MNSRRKLMIAGCTIVAASVSYAFHARAGDVINNELTVSPSEQFFEGSIGATRFASDPYGYISCKNVVTANSSVGTCSAGDATHSRTASCSTTNVNLINAIRSINSLSHVYVRYDSTGACARIDVTQSSRYLFN